MRTGAATWAVVGGVLALFASSMWLSPSLAVVMMLPVCLVCVAVIARMSVATVGVMLVVMFSFTASWDQASLAGIKPRMIFVLLGLLLLVLGGGIDHRPYVPWWIHAYALSAIAVSFAHFYFPISQAYLNSRYLTSSFGLSLGSRLGTLNSLLSLLFNSYAVPVAIVLACMFHTKALRWIITAYVTGAALSNFAAYLGFEGYPALLRLFVPPAPTGTRALGFTSHPLHLATSGVLGVALACWLAVQPGAYVKWCGRVSIVALFLGLYASGSRGGNAAGVAALALSAFLLPTVRRRIHTVAAVAAIAVAGLVIFTPSVGTAILRTTRLYGGLTNDVSDTGRTQVIDQGLADFQHSPVFGIGVRYIAEAHVLYAGVLASGGVILFAAYLAFNIGSLQAARRALAVDRTLGGALLATLLATLGYWSVADDFQVASVQIVYGLLLAALLHERREPSSTTAFRLSPGIVGPEPMAGAIRPPEIGVTSEHFADGAERPVRYPL